MNVQSAVILYLVVIYAVASIGIIIATRKFATYYQAKTGCSPGAARKAARMIAIPIWVINTISMLAFVYLSIQPL